MLEKLKKPKSYTPICKSLQNKESVITPGPEYVDNIFKIGKKTERAIIGLQRFDCKLGYDIGYYPNGKQSKPVWYIITPNNRKISAGTDKIPLHYFFRIMYARIRRKYRLEEQIRINIVKSEIS